MDAKGCRGTPVGVWRGQYRRVLKDELVSATLVLFVLNEMRGDGDEEKMREERKEKRGI